jgi:spore coat protein U-like protein
MMRHPLPDWATNLMFRFLCLSILLLASPVYASSFSCAVSSNSGISLIYDPASPTQTVGTGSVAINCTKSGSNSATVYYELGIDGGVNLSGVQSRTINGTSAINYNTWRDNGNSQVWNDISSNRIKGSLSSTSSSTVYVNYYVSIPASQNVGAGTYLDTQTVRLYQGLSAGAASTDISPTSQPFGVSLTVAAKCSLSSPPGNVHFNYTSFQTSASLASTSFAVTCLNNTTYSMALDSISGTLLGLNYSLSLSKSGTQTGNGFAQSATVNGSMAGGQSGTCNGASCTSNETRTLTISY